MTVNNFATATLIDSTIGLATRDASGDPALTYFYWVTAEGDCGESAASLSAQGSASPKGDFNFDGFIDGDDLLKMNSKQLIELRRNKMGMVFQSFALLPHKTVLENIAFPLQVKGQSTKESIERAAAMIDLVSLSGRENYYPRQLSGGQQQRVGIARSLAVEPDIWVLDEPFSALDPLIRREMQDEFMRLQGMLNKTILFVTHDFEEALRLADRIAIMKDGVIEQIDTPANIVLNPSTEYVAKFTNDVPREKVLRCESVMEDAAQGAKLSTMRIPGDAIIETVAEAILNEAKPVPVVDEQDQMIGVLNRKTIIHTLFGKDQPA